jgi:transcriptional regulator with XRE-family HTH domain
MSERTGISQAVLAGFMNVAVNTVSQWERSERELTGAALKLLNVVKHNGHDALQGQCSAYRRKMREKPQVADKYMLFKPNV